MSTPDRPLGVDRGGSAASRRWAEVRALAEAALALPSEARAGLLEVRCAADPALRAEVEAQVAACEGAAGAAFLSESAAARAAPLFALGAAGADAERPEASSGAAPSDSELEATLREALTGRYAVERELGRGGTATVFVARDSRHGRRVALKVLDPAVGAGMSADRFLREIRVTAGLTHPNILPLHDSGEAAGLLYYVMPYVEGETLRDRLARDGALPLGEALRLLREVADALAYAHAHGVVHRDVKPANILLHEGHALVADFGIARALHRAHELQEPTAPGDPTGRGDDGAMNTITAAGTSPGTPAYMAPEQATGGAVDERADLYAFGVVAYELLAGTHPFGARTQQALIEAHLAESPPPLAARRRDVPPALAALVARLLAKNPADRPAGAEAVLHALDTVRLERPGLTPARRRAALALAPLLLAGGVAGYVGWRGLPVSGEGQHRAGAPAGVASAPLHAVAVLPFVNASGNADDDYFSDGLTDELAHALTQVPGVRLAGRTATYALKGKALAAREVGRALGVDAFVDGTVRRAGDRLRVTAQLVSAADGTVRWDSVFETRARDLFAVQDALTHAIAAALTPALRGRAGAEDRAADIERGTADQEAYELFLKGRYNFLLRNPTRLLRAIAFFRQAIARDPGFARAHAGLAMAYTLLPVYFPSPVDTPAALAWASARRAVALDSTLGDAQFALASALEMQLRFREAVAHYRAGLVRDPTSVTGHFWLGVSLLNLGRTDEALVELRLATQLDPLAHSAASAVAMALLAARRYPEAAAAARHSLAIDSTFWGGAWPLGMALTFAGQPGSGARTLEWALRLHPDHPQLTAGLVLAYAAAARWRDAARLRAQLHRPGGDLSGGVAAAEADLVFGDREPALRLLTTAAGQRAWYLSGAFLGCTPLLDPLRPDPRFRAAMRRLSEEPCPLARPWPIPARPM